MKYCAIFLAIWLLVPASSEGQGKRELPVGLILESSAAQVHRARTSLPLTAGPGDLLFSGDTLVTGSRSSTKFLYCPEKSTWVLGPDTEVVFESQQLRIKKGNLSNHTIVPFCMLPELERSQAIGGVFYGDLRKRALDQPQTGSLQDRIRELSDAERQTLLAELDAIEIALKANRNDAVSLLAKAILLQKYNLRVDAAAAYKEVAAVWPESVWTRQLLHLPPETSRRHDEAINRPPKSAEGKTYALLVGISKYQRLSELEFLKFADQDAITFDQHLRSARGGSVAPENIVLLVNDRGTTAAIRNNINQFLQIRAGPNDTVVLFIAAHGIVSDTDIDRDAYIVTYDSDPQDLKSTALPMGEVQQLMDAQLQNVGRVLVFIDVCHAGNIGTIRDRKGNKVNAIVAKLLERQGQIFGLLASQPDEYSIEAKNFGGGHGAFTYFLLRGLNGEADKNGDGIVDPNEIFTYVFNQVQDATYSQQHPDKKGFLSSDTSLADIEKDGIQLGPYVPLQRAELSSLRKARNVKALQAGTEAMPKTKVKRISQNLALFDDALEAGRILPETPQSAFIPLRQLKKDLAPEEFAIEEGRLRIALEDKAQQVLLRYLEGDQIPQTRSDFVDGGLYLAAAETLPPESTVLESKKHFCRGRALIFDRKYPAAVALLERAARLDPKGAYSYNALGIAYLEQADYERAKLAFRDATQRAPHWAYPWHNLALTYTESGQYDAAIRCYQQGMRLAPQFSYLPYNLGLLYQRLNRRADAQQSYRKAIAISPSLAEPFNALGSLQALSGHFAEAERLYRKALDNNSDLLAARHNLAVLLSKRRGRIGEAVDLWRLNLVKSPDYLPSRISLAETLETIGRLTEAIQEYETILKSKPDYAAARRALAGLLLKSNKLDAALRELKETLKRTPRNAELHEQIGDVEKSMGRADEAKAAYRAALANAWEPTAKKRIRKKIKSLTIAFASNS